MIVGSDCYDRWLTSCSIANFSVVLPDTMFKNFSLVVISVEDWFVGSDAQWFYVDLKGFDSSLNFKTFFSNGSASSLDRKSAAVFIFLGINANTELNCSTKSQAFQNGDDLTLVRKDLVTNLLSVMMTASLVAPQKKCPNSFSAN